MNEVPGIPFRFRDKENVDVERDLGAYSGFCLTTGFLTSFTLNVESVLVFLLMGPELLKGLKVALFVFPGPAMHPQLRCCLGALAFLASNGQLLYHFSGTSLVIWLI